MADRKQYMKEWREKNRKRLNEYQAERRRRDPEESRDINRKSAAKRRAKDPDAENKRVREWRRANRAKVARHLADYAKNHPLKDLAHKMVHAATRSGALVKSDTCEGCGKATEPRELHGHHEDYGKPLEVRWLCVGCHREVHRAAGG